MLAGAAIATAYFVVTHPAMAHYELNRLSRAASQQNTQSN
jgi:hypothetical protein